MKLSMILLLSIVGSALAVFPLIPEYVEETTQSEEDGTSLPISMTQQHLDAKTVEIHSDVNDDGNTEESLVRHTRASMIPVYIIKSKAERESTKVSPANVEKEPAKTEEVREAAEESKHFGSYNPALIRQYQYLNQQGYGPAQPYYGMYTPIYQPFLGALQPLIRPPRPIYSTGQPGYGFGLGYRPNYDQRPINNPAFVPVFDTSSRDFYGYSYDD